MLNKTGCPGKAVDSQLLFFKVKSIKAGGAKPEIRPGLVEASLHF
jgi:hypothetical protein